MVRSYFWCLYLLSVSILFCQDNKSNSSKSLFDFQKSLIDKKISGSNEIVIFKEGNIVYNNIQNSFKDGDKKITNETLFPIWSMSKVITTIGILQLIEKGLCNSFEI